MAIDVQHLVTYHPPNDERKVLHGKVRDTIGNAMTEMEKTLKDSREKSLVFTKLEEAMFWANACIARNQ